MSTAVMEPKTGYEISIARTFDAPRELVWKAFTEPAMLKEWMGPRGFQATSFEIPTKVGEPWWLEMTGHVPATQQPVTLRQGGVIKEIRPPELLSYTFAWDDRTSVGLSESPFKESVVTIRLEEQGRKTVMHFTQGPFATEGERDGHTGGWNSSFDRFAEFMLREQPTRNAATDDVPSELHMRRFFAAPRQMVFDAWTKPEMVKEWWGPKGFTVPVCEMDARQGGEFLIRMKAPDGTVCGMKGRYVEFYPPYRFHYIGMPLDKDDNPMAETWTSVFFEEKDGGTEVVLDGHFTKSPPDAARFIKGASQGWSQMLDKLAEFVGRRM